MLKRITNNVKREKTEDSSVFLTKTEFRLVDFWLKSKDKIGESHRSEILKDFALKYIVRKALYENTGLNWRDYESHNYGPKADITPITVPESDKKIYYQSEIELDIPPTLIEDYYNMDDLVIMLGGITLSDY